MSSSFPSDFPALEISTRARSPTDHLDGQFRMRLSIRPLSVASRRLVDGGWWMCLWDKIRSINRLDPSPRELSYSSSSSSSPSPRRRTTPNDRSDVDAEQVVVKSEWPPLMLILYYKHGSWTFRGSNRFLLCHLFDKRTRVCLTFSVILRRRRTIVAGHSAPPFSSLHLLPLLRFLRLLL